MNQLRYLPQCVESVLSQLEPGDEYVVVDAGSTDGSREYLQGIDDPRIKLIFEGDDGPADGLRKGLAALSTEIMGFLNADDYLLPGALSWAREQLRSDTDRAVVASGHCVVVDENHDEVRAGISTRFSMRRFVAGATCLMQPSTFFTRRAYQDSPGIRPSNRTCWDGELWRDLAQTGASFRIRDDYVSAFRLHGGSISGSGRLQDIYDSEIAILRREVGTAGTATSFVYRGMDFVERRWRRLRTRREFGLAKDAALTRGDVTHDRP